MKNEYGIYFKECLYLHFDVPFSNSVFRIISDFSVGSLIEFSDSVVVSIKVDVDIFPESESNKYLSNMNWYGTSY